jgi:hypothetical protein
MSLPAGIKEHIEGGVNTAFYSYASMHAKIIRNAILKSIPEHIEFEQEIADGFIGFISVIPYLFSVQVIEQDTSSTDAVDNQVLLAAWWETAQAAIKEGKWRQIWDGYTTLPYESQRLLLSGYLSTRREVIGSSPDLRGGQSGDVDQKKRPSKRGTHSHKESNVEENPTTPQ